MHVYIVEQKSGDRHFFKLSINLILDAAAAVALKSDDPMNAWMNELLLGAYLSKWMSVLLFEQVAAGGVSVFPSGQCPVWSDSST